MKSILLFALLLFFSNSFAQLDKRVYLNEDFDTCTIENARFYVENKPSSSVLRTSREVYYLDGSLKSVHNYIPGSSIILDGPTYSYYDNGQLKDSMIYNHNDLEGVYYKYFKNGQLKVKATFVEDEFQDSLLTFHSSGNKKRIDFYDHGKLISGAIFDEKGNSKEYEEYYVESSFPGGNKEMMTFIVNNVRYPREAIKYNVEGKVYLKFEVDSLGSIRHIEIVRSISPILSEAAIDVVEKMPKWIPGRIDGENYNSYFQLPINFTLEGNSNKFSKPLTTNLFWTKKDKLIDPISSNEIQVSKRGKTTIYYKESDQSVTKSVSLSVKELEEFRYMKFASERTCNEWYHLFNQQKVEDLKKMGR